MSWWPIDNPERNGDSCDRCGNTVGLSRDDQGRVYCPSHRHLHDD